MEFRFFCFSVIFFSATTGPQENGQFVQLTPKAIIHSKKKGPEDAPFVLTLKARILHLIVQ